MGQAGERIRRLRTSKGLTQGNLADIWLTTQDRISKIETGQLQIKADEYLELEKFLQGVEKIGTYQYNGNDFRKAVKV